MKKNNLPELLLPAGNIEAFQAAVAGGADAVYLGLKNFNARGRAKNFLVHQLQSLLKTAEKAGIKVYVTLNTLVKNEELAELLDTLHLLSQTTVSAVIIQDLGTYYLIRKFFPKLKIHASTQMSVHNSIGAEFMRKLGFERVILFREITLPELKLLKQRTTIELEIFVHGALCYSFSGQCLYSSYLGGMSANRGLCRQPCRRIYTANDQEKYLFNLKDNQQLAQIAELKKMGIASLKIEGRMKSAEYVYNTARAYRLALQGEDAAAEEFAAKDLARQKSSYFLGGDISAALTEKPYTGKHIADLQKAEPGFVQFVSSQPLQRNNRLRILPQSGHDSAAFKLKENFTQEKEEKGWLVKVSLDQDFQAGDKVFLVGWGELKFKNKFSLDGKKVETKMPRKKQNNILQKIGSSKQAKRQQIFVRIDSIKWMMKIYLPKIDFLILRLSKTEWQDFDPRTGFVQKKTDKLMVELPKFIAENELEFYRELCSRLYRNGFKKFMISHISQKLLLPQKNDIQIASNENVYILNDAAIQMLKEQNIGLYLYPQESEFDNLQKGKDRRGIMPLYFYPELFFSRMPIGLEDEQEFTDKTDSFHKTSLNGLTVILPNRPVSFLQYKTKLDQQGFRRYLLDFSYCKPSQKLFQRVLNKFEYSEAEQPSTNFNFKLGLK
ncbi:MAG: peptidase U32 family protein [Candidatus Cloacimonadales bacterium]